jgi:esterase
MRLHYQVQGGGRPLVILHGFLGSLENWRVMSKRFANICQVFSVDLRNHGRSPHSMVMNYPVMAEDLRELILEQRLSDIFLLGHSMGGKVAMQLAVDTAEHVKKLVVVDIAPKSYPPSHRPLLIAMQELELRGMKSFADADAALAPAIADAALRRFLIKNLIRDTEGSFHWRIALDAILSNYDQLIKPPALEKIFDKPACFIRGSRSSFINEDDRGLIREHFPRAEVRTIANAGHWAHIDAPEEFYRVVSAFLMANG